MRNPNTVCAYCGTPIYRTPLSIISGSVYCSRECHRDARGAIKEIACCGCGIIFKPSHKHLKYCSHSCSNTARRGIAYDKKSRGNDSRRKLALLKATFSFKTCMVEGCDYNNTFDIHRHIEGKKGGEYIVGNMFAICPNHHAEVSRKLIAFEKINDFTLRIIQGELSSGIGAATSLEN